MRATAKSRVTRIELKTDKQTAYRRNEPIRVTVRFPDDAPAPPPEQAVKVQVARQADHSCPAGRPRSATPRRRRVRRCPKVDGHAGPYETLLHPHAGGRVHVHPDRRLADHAGQPPRAEARVLPPPGERDRLEMNRAELTRAAAESAASSTPWPTRTR